MKTAITALALATLVPLGTARAQSDPLAPLRDLVVRGQASVRQAMEGHAGRHAHHTVRHAARHEGRHGHAMASHRVTVPARLHAKAAPRKPIDQLKVAESQGFKKVSDLVAFPPFYPTLGIVTVKPDTLPVGPYRCFDRAGRLVSTVYMLPLKDMEDHHQWDHVQGLPAPVDHATAYFHPGHAGVQIPHYHLVLWHTKDESSVAK